MTRKIWWSIISVLGLSIILMLSQLIHIPVLTVSEQQGEEVLIIPLFHGRDFDYQYLHSVQKPRCRSILLLHRTINYS